MVFSAFSSDKFSFRVLCKILLILALFFYLIFIPRSCPYPNFPSLFFSTPPHPKKTSLPTSDEKNAEDFPSTNLSHLVFGLLGSERAWHHRKAYIESWWRPNVTRGFLYLDKEPTRGIVPWSTKSPPYRVSENLSQFLRETRARAPVMIRMVHGIMEVFNQVDHENMRWLVMGDDDSIFFVDNMVDVLAKLDHTKYYYLGGKSEFILSNYWFSFNQGFGGAGFILSYPLAKALAMDMEGCLRRYAHLTSADLITKNCIADIGVDLSPQQGNHQIDLHGDISGFLSSHSQSPLMSLHHFDAVEPIFPSMNRFESTRHLMKAANIDQSRMLQQTICHHRPKNWTFSISWGYSAQIYESIMPKSTLQKPIETFKPWLRRSKETPHYMMNTRLMSNDSCESPHVFFFESIKRRSNNEVVTRYSRKSRRGLLPCGLSENVSADFISRVRVKSSGTKRKEMDRCECCDIVRVDSNEAELRFRECMTDEILA